jgi:hypothetical protein
MLLNHYTRSVVALRKRADLYRLPPGYPSFYDAVYDSNHGLRRWG